jgi:hypothetical protein
MTAVRWNRRPACFCNRVPPYPDALLAIIPSCSEPRTRRGHRHAPPRCVPPPPRCMPWVSRSLKPHNSILVAGYHYRHAEPKRKVGAGKTANGPPPLSFAAVSPSLLSLSPSSRLFVSSSPCLLPLPAPLLLAPCCLLPASPFPRLSVSPLPRFRNGRGGPHLDNEKNGREETNEATFPLL